jgi:hypothetical protein
MQLQIQASRGYHVLSDLLANLLEVSLGEDETDVSLESAEGAPNQKT